MKHVGEAIWDEDFEQFHYADVTRLDVEEGNVSSQIIIEVDGRPQRIKTPSDRTREVRERIEHALLSYHDVDSYAEFEATAAPDEESEPEADRSVSLAEDDVFGGGVDPLDANPPELDEEGQVVEEPPADQIDESDIVDPEPEPVEATAETQESETSESETATDEKTEPTGFADSGFESASENLDDPTEAQLAALTEAVERQNELLERQQHTIERLIEELTRAR